MASTSSSATTKKAPAKTVPAKKVPAKTARAKNPPATHASTKTKATQDPPSNDDKSPPPTKRQRERQRQRKARQTDSQDSSGTDGGDSRSSAQPSMLSKEELIARRDALGFGSVRWLNADGSPKTIGQILALQMSTWKADIYGHFEKKPKLVRMGADDKIGYSFKCRSVG
ncbi:hypothetical protein BOTBODRAFT_182118 [Botryobasidium botryosum FD-172 SS1]|uniref:Uncharacterized protein n=1 Tax=Botryobasidium botryosum (strain FD-172 SS1) TaxID=930990 RepID=A0A067M2V9_BOTB1|nr:hypothetical protein BOTBODRAFT_182118 [Botryobasidium botryosum FD-172 SS1]